MLPDPHSPHGHARAGPRTALLLAAVAALAVALGSGLLAACGSTPPSGPAAAAAAGEAMDAVPPPLDHFSAARAWGDFEALARTAPDEAAAMSYVEAQLGTLGVRFEPLVLRLPVEVDAAPDVVSGRVGAIAATLPGDSTMLFVLLAPLPQAGAPASDAADPRRSAADSALLLEIARVLSTRRLPYTTLLIWLGEDAATPGAASSALAARMEDDAMLERVRLLVALDTGCAPDLRIARDLGSHRMHRETFFRAAQELGRSETFPPMAGFEAVPGAHLAFRERGVRTVVALRDTSLDGAAPADAAAAAAPVGAACAPESLESVGVVVLAGVDVIGQRLAKIDRFTRAPLVADVHPDRGAESAGSGAPEVEEAPTPDGEAPQ